MDLAAEMNRLLAKRNARPSVGETPLKDRKSVASESMQPAVCIDDQLQRDVV